MNIIQDPVKRIRNYKVRLKIIQHPVKRVRNYKGKVEYNPGPSQEDQELQR